jgi:hypothetical protein
MISNLGNQVFNKQFKSTIIILGKNIGEDAKYMSIITKSMWLLTIYYVIYYLIFEQP